MTTIKRPCLDCGIPVRASRCPKCAEKKLPIYTPGGEGSNTTTRGYGYKWQKMRRLILDRDQWTCYKCQKKLEGSDATVDHLIPLATDRTQTLDPAQLAACCRSCNSRAGGKMTRTQG